MCLELLKSSIGKKQIVAVTGLAMILFLVGHLAGNLFIFAGPEAFNGYAKKLAGLRPGLLVVEFGLLAVFLTHAHVTLLLVLENIKASGGSRYAVANTRGQRSWATKLRVYTGLFLLGFVVWHLLDFTFSDHHGPRSLLNGESLGLYGVVYSSFLDPIHSALYIIAMGCLGFHLAHGVQSFMQTFGLSHPKYTPMVQKISNVFAFLIAGGFSSIPIYVLIRG